MAVGKETEKGAGDEGRRSALALYEDIEAEHMAALEATGIAFAPYDSERLEREGLLRQLRERGARIRNGGASVAIGPMSVACEACTGSCVVRATFSMASPAGRFGCRARLPGLHCAYWR